MAKVRFTCTPDNLPSNEMVTVENKGRGQLYLRDGDVLHLVTSTNLPACTIASRDFRLHGHVASQKERDGTITIEHQSSRAKDRAFYTDYGISYEVEKHAPLNKDNERKKLGVGECVFLLALPSSLFETWDCEQGEIHVKSSPSTYYTAPEFETNDVVIATFKKQLTSVVSISIVEPQSYSVAKVTGRSYPVGTIGSGMTFSIDILPKDVSLDNVSIMELPRLATNVYGVFANTNVFPYGPHAHDGNHGAGRWIPIVSNHIGDIAEISYLPAMDEDSGYTWPIPAVWKVSSIVSASPKPLPWSDQVFAIRTNAVVSVSKYLKTAIRGKNMEKSEVQ